MQNTHTHTVICIIQYSIILQYYTHVYASRFHCSLVWFHTIWVLRRYVLLWANAVKSSDWLWTSGCWDIVDRFEPEITVMFNVLHVFAFLSYQNHGDSISFCIMCGFDGHLGKIKLRQHRTQIAEDIFWCQPSTRLFCFGINVISIRARPNAHTAIDISQRPPAATPAPKLHSAHRTLTAPCSSIQVPKMQTAFCSGSKAAPTCQLQSAHATLTEAPWSNTLQRYPAAAPCNSINMQAPEGTPHSDSTLKQHHIPQQHQQAGLQDPEAHTPLSQQHPQAAPCSGTLPPHQHAHSKARTPLWQQNPAPPLCSSTLQQHPAAASACPPQSAHHCDSSILKQHPAAPPCSSTSMPAPKRRHAIPSLNPTSFATWGKMTI